jgi:hypothetical protein
MLLRVKMAGDILASALASSEPSPTTSARPTVDQEAMACLTRGINGVSECEDQKR